MHILILTRQIGHYHDARYRGAFETFDRVSVVQTSSEGGFSELLAKQVGNYDIHALYQNRAEYDAALKSGNLSTNLSELLDQIGPDIIAVAGWANAESAVGIRWGRKNDVPIVMMSESQQDDASRSWLRERVKAQMVRLSDSAFVGGPSHAEYIEKLGMPKNQITLGYNAVDNDHFTKGAAEARANADTLRSIHGLPESFFLASARFIAKKNLPALITAHAEFSRQNENAPALVILGEGNEKPKIEAARNAHPYPIKVLLPGYKSYDDLPIFYGLAEAFIHVSTIEQWGLVVNEAMSAGTPVIVSERCGVARTVVRNGISGIITGTQIADITAAITQFSKMSNEERRAMGNQATEDFAGWGPERFGMGLREAAQKAQDLYVPKKQLSLLDAIILRRIEYSAINQVS